jgi:fatty-acyl-CoA synthase
MGLKARLSREIRFLRGLRRTLRWVSSIKPDSRNLACDDLEAAVDKWRAKPAIICEGKTLTYGEFDALANRYAHWAKAQGLTRGETVALYMHNRLDYVAIWYGLSKVGVVTSLINNQLTGAALAHCINISGALHCLVDADCTPALQAVRESLTRHVQLWTLGVASSGQRDLTNALKSCSSLRPDREVSRGDLRAKDLALYIYTSGTTGLPKAARVTHMRVQLYMRGFAGSTGAVDSDRIYITLPLYHATGGLCAVGAGLLTGGSLVLRRRFSASAFWDDIVQEGCTMFVYIGELGRYLVNQPEHPLERDHKLRLAFGNGLRPDVWQAFIDRFKIPFVLEFYGATEGNVSIFNFDGKLGACGRVPRYLKRKFPIRLVQFDIDSEQPVRNAQGRCVEAGPGQVGECIGMIGREVRTSYTGYADRAASEKKVLHDVFAAGDSWFATGDLMTQDADGYFYFVDRIGDTFRWKGENVSTGEVSACLVSAPGVLEANVYGVKIGDLDGRAGMAALSVGEGFDVTALQAHVEECLPGYAQPVFLRLQREIATTGTFKQRKVDLIADGFDPARTKEPLYFRNPDKGSYVKITRPMYAKILEGGFKL